jgi:hypothetical protein
LVRCYNKLITLPELFIYVIFLSFFNCRNIIRALLVTKAAGCNWYLFILIYIFIKKRLCLAAVMAAGRKARKGGGAVLASQPKCLA